jgi:hypothetical protein
MEIGKLVTLAFSKNVGTVDRVFRLLSGVSLTVAPWCVDVPTWARATMTVLGLMWTATGVLSKCSIYYALGYSTCPHDPSAARETGR